MVKKKKERIGTIKGIDLVKKSAPIQDMRIISEDDYKEKWDKWCDIMQAEIMQR